MVKSNNNNLASNALHFLDLICWITSKKIVKVDTSGIYNWINSKRNGFKEFEGSLKFIFEDNSQLCLTNDILSKNQFIKIKVNNDEYNILDYYEKIIKNKNYLIKSNNLSVSQIMKQEVQNIIKNKRVNLPKYQDIHDHHYQLIKNLLINYNNINRTRLRHLPIT